MHKRPSCSSFIIYHHGCEVYIFPFTGLPKKCLHLPIHSGVPKSCGVSSNIFLNPEFEQHCKSVVDPSPPPPEGEESELGRYIFEELNNRKCFFLTQDTLCAPLLIHFIYKRVLPNNIGLLYREHTHPSNFTIFPILYGKRYSKIW